MAGAHSSSSPNAGALAASAKIEDTVRAGRAAVGAPAATRRRTTCLLERLPGEDQRRPRLSPITLCQLPSLKLIFPTMIRARAA
jgi:hypothetical protein